MVTTLPKPQEGHCVKCRQQREMQEAERVTMKNGRPALKGKCLECGTGIFRILSNKEVQEGE